mmetsp:Transcript_28353/g.62317  ORF Transcript_28353/g.62317 Transcript_28353/m.62317 type:complete len:275 (-) Transcript_28353:1084-1908(-)
MPGGSGAVHGAAMPYACSLIALAHSSTIHLTFPTQIADLMGILGYLGYNRLPGIHSVCFQDLRSDLCWCFISCRSCSSRSPGRCCWCGHQRCWACPSRCCCCYHCCCRRRCCLPCRCCFPSHCCWFRCCWSGRPSTWVSGGPPLGCSLSHRQCSCCGWPGWQGRRLRRSWRKLGQRACSSHRSSRRRRRGGLWRLRLPRRRGSWRVRRQVQRSLPPWPRLPGSCHRWRSQWTGSGAPASCSHSPGPARRPGSRALASSPDQSGPCRGRQRSGRS